MFLRVAVIFLIFCCTASATDSIKKLLWDGVEVIWLQDNRFPKYDLSIYFSDGALSDSSSFRGETNAMFGMIDSGTRRYTQKEISENLEFYGVNYGHYVTHEYSTYNISGLVKDIVPTMKKICHMFSDANFPVKEIRKEKRRIKSSLNNLIADKGALASRAFREISLRGTDFGYPVGGKKRDIKKWTHKRLKKKLAYFNQNVLKRIYVTGPREVLNIQSIITNECGWKGDKKQIIRKSSKTIRPRKKAITLVTVPRSNQAQIRIGRVTNANELSERELVIFMTEFLGGGFTSQLMKEVRVKRGLTYSIGAFAARQKDYGRAGISTSTKNSSVVESIEVIKGLLENLGKNEFSNEELELARGQLVGSYPFRFESSSSYLGLVEQMDHIGEDYTKIYDFPENIKSISKEDVAKRIASIFDWEKLSIVVLGNKSLLKKLRTLGRVKVVKYQKFL